MAVKKWNDVHEFEYFSNEKREDRIRRIRSAGYKNQINNKIVNKRGKFPG